MRDVEPEQSLQATVQRSAAQGEAEVNDRKYSARLPATSATRLKPDDVGSLQRLAGNAAVARMLRADDEADGRDSPGASVHSLLESSSGRPLDAATQAHMEPAFGRSFDSVRVHEGAEAASSARQLGAQAYTVGQDIVLGQGHPDLSSDAGKRVLAHELTHVVQQEHGPVDGTPVEGGVAVSDPTDRFEREAEHTADAVMAGAHGEKPGTASATPTPTPTPTQSAGAAAASVQRNTEEETSESESTQHGGGATGSTEHEAEEAESTE